jgi:hypothetical protein
MKGINMMSLLCLFAISLMVCAGVIADVSCQSMVMGDRISASVDYEQNAVNIDTCASIQSVYSSRLVSRSGDYQSIVSGSSSGLTQATAANINGMYRDSLSTMQVTGVCEEGCENCGDEVGAVTYVKSQFATSSIGSALGVQTIGTSNLNEMTGQALITGSGTSSITASSLDMSTISSDSFAQRVQAGGSNVTAGMIFSWVR